MEINDTVAVTVNIPENNIEKGMLGVIVAVFDHPEVAYEVEFCNDNGETTAEIALKPEQLEPLITQQSFKKSTP